MRIFILVFSLLWSVPLTHAENLLEPYVEVLKPANLKSLRDIQKRIPDAEIYRFYIFRSFHPAVVFTVASDGTVEFIIIRNFGDLDPNYRVIQQSIITFRESEVRPIFDLMKKIPFWSLKTDLTYTPMTDGSNWIVEGIKKGNYHIVDRRSPLDQTPPGKNDLYAEGQLTAAFYFLWGLTHQSDPELY